MDNHITALFKEFRQTDGLSGDVLHQELPVAIVVAALLDFTSPGAINMELELLLVLQDRIPEVQVRLLAHVSWGAPTGSTIATLNRRSMANG